MKHLSYIFLCFFLGFQSTQAQMEFNGESKFGNEWIDYDQDYYKIKVAKNGVFRIGYDALIDAGVPVGQISADQFQLYFRGAQVPVNISSMTTMEPGDYIDFYGQKNDGFIDQFIIEKGAEGQLNPDYSLFNDTSAYFLSWKVGAENLRMDTYEGDIENSNLAPTTEYQHKQRLVFKNWHYKPVFNGTDRVRWSDINMSEGYGGNYGPNNSVNFELQNFISTSNADATISVRYGNNPGNIHRTEFKVNGQVVGEDTFDENEVRVFSYSFPASQLSNEIVAEVNSVRNPNSERNIMSIAELDYPRALDFDGAQKASFTLNPSTIDQLLEILNFNVSNDIALYDLTNGMQIRTTVDNGVVKTLIPASDVEREFLLFSETQILQVQDLEKKKFVDYSLEDPEFIIYTSEKLNSGSDNMVTTYADYRRSVDGGEFDVAIVESEQLYDQFAYGIDRHSISVKNFSNYIKTKWQNAQYNFVLGKGYEYPLVRTNEQLASEGVFDKFMVPTFGFPGSDNMLFAAFGSAVPFASTGRLAAQNSDHISIYLDKVKAHQNPVNNDQSIDDQLWKKRIIHLSGGDAEIKNYIYSSLNTMGELIKNNKFGAEVTTFQKESNGVEEISISDQIFNAINEGVSIITFFGHSAVGTLDFSVEDLSKYDNAERLPIFIALGCNSGNVHTKSFGVSEDFVLEPKNGSIAFLSSSSVAYASREFDSGLLLYSYAGGEFYGKSIGDLVKQKLIVKDTFPDIPTRSLNQQLTLHGDPAINLHPKNGPDYVVDYGSIKTEPEIVGTNDDEFQLNFEVANLGDRVSDSITILGIYELPDGVISDSVYTKIEAPSFKSAASLSFNIPGISARGKNSIRIEVDFNDAIEEHPQPAADLNNKVFSPDGEEGYCFFVIDNNVVPIFPREFSIINSSDVSLQVSTNNAFAQEQTYQFQIDTTQNFNSPLMEQTTIKNRGGIISWNPNLNFETDKVYYWRAAALATDGKEPLWSNSSFIYLEGENQGWNQSHFYQYKDDQYFSLNLKDDTRDFEFGKTPISISIKNQFYDFQDFWVFVNSTPFGTINASNERPYIGVYVFDPQSVFWFNGGTDYGSFSHSRDLFPYKMDKIEDRQGMAELLEAVPDGNRVFFQTFLDDETTDFKVDEWAADSITLGYNLFSVLESYGATKVRLMEERGTVPYTFVFDKGGDVVLEEIGQNINDFHQVSTTADVFVQEGYIESDAIGPVKSWDKVIWSEEKLEGDQTRLQVYGLRIDGTEELLVDTLDTYDIDISFIDVDSFPQIKLRFSIKDLTDITPASLDYWRVIYTGLPDAAIDLRDIYTFNSDTLEQGQNLNLSMGLTNVTEIDMDSILVSYTIKDAANNINSVTKKLPPLKAKQTYPIDFETDSNGFNGDYELTIEVNPLKSPQERYYFNNFALTRFNVGKDKNNPLLDVTFDGLHILNGDLVAPTPNITVLLKDDNPYLPLTDINSFELQLVYPDGTFWDVPLDDASINFIPASDDKNEARLEFNPSLDQEGTYKLFVNGKDAAGNLAGSYTYEVEFEVILSQMVSNVLNYPNPFSTATQFVFTITGELPEIFYIQIMTLSGKVVKEITQSELGDLRIGMNRTNYRWDGTDDYGNQLANGVYLYRVITKDSQLEDIDRFSTSANQYFKEGFGKLVIMR